MTDLRFNIILLFYFSCGYESSLIRRLQLTKLAVHTRTLVPYRSLPSLILNVETVQHSLFYRQWAQHSLPDLKRPRQQWKRRLVVTHGLVKRCQIVE